MNSKVIMLIFLEYLLTRILLFLILGCIASGEQYYNFLFKSVHYCGYAPNVYGCSMINSIFYSPLGDLVNIISIVIILITIICLKDNKIT